MPSLLAPSVVGPLTDATSALPQLRASQFRAIQALAHRISGIHLPAGKEGLVRSRLARRLRRLGLRDFDTYLKFLRTDTSGNEIPHLIEALTTNKTSFFREPRHFQYLADHVLPDALAEGRPLRFWSAGCSSGEEAYSLAMLVQRHSLGRRTDVRILATDIAAGMLDRARRGEYDEKHIERLPDGYRQYFEPVRRRQSGHVAVRAPVRELVRFARLNLMAEWPMRGPFDAILCRNVMIYFDKPTQQLLVEHFEGVLRPGGHLFVGHSESLSGVKHSLRFVQPAVYRR